MGVNIRSKSGTVCGDEFTNVSDLLDARGNIIDFFFVFMFFAPFFSENYSQIYDLYQDYVEYK